MAAGKSDYLLNIRLGYVIKFLQQFHFVGGVLIPFFTLWGGISFFQVMILQAVFMLSIFLLEVPTGAVADRFGRKTSLIMAGFVIAIAAFVYTSYPVFWVFVLGEFIWAIGSSLISGADSAIVYDSLKMLKRESESKKILGRWSGIGLIAMMIAAPIGSFIAEFLGLKYAMMFMAAPFILSSIVALFIREPKVNSNAKREKYWKTMHDGLMYFKDHKVLRIIVFDYVVITTMIFFIIWVYQVVLSDIGISIKWFGFVHAVLTLSQVIVLNSFTFIDRIFVSKRRYVQFGSVISGIAFIALAFSFNVWLSIFCVAIVSLFGLTRKPLLQNYMHKHILSKNRATVMSVVSMLYSLGAVVVNLVFGYMVNWDLRYSLILIGVLILIMSLVSRIEEIHLKD